MAATAVGEVLVLTHTFKAPVELVWEAWTQPEHLVQWWGPQGFTNPKCDADVRVGGTLYVEMQGPDGTIYPMGATFSEVIPQEKLVFVSHALDDNGNVMFEVKNSVTFQAQSGSTSLTLEAEVVSTTAGSEQYVQGMEEGWTQSLSKLDAHLEPSRA